MRRTLLIAMAALLVALMSTSAYAGGKVGIYGLRQIPDGDDAKDYSRAGWGGGLHAVVPLPQVHNIFAFVGGFEITNLKNETLVFYDPIWQGDVEQQTDQNIYRIFIGGQIGGHGNGFIRPHAGINLSLSIYNIKTDNVIRDDDEENEIRNNVFEDNEAAFGSDITLGIDLNFNNMVNLDGGVRYLKTFSVPQQLGGKSETIHPQYFQVYLGVGVSFRALTKWSDD